MAEEDPYQIKTIEELRQHYDMPGEMVTKTKFDFLDDYAISYIRLTPLVCIGTEMGEGLDVSPRGGEPGFVHVIDRRHLAIPDWPGNNKVETMTNLVHSGRCGLLFLVPGMDLFLRVNGPAVITRDPALLAKMTERGKTPKSAIRVTTREVYFHCGKALKRSKIWEPESWPPRSAMPTAGKMILDQAKLADTMTAEDIDAMYQKALKDDLY
jgi:PPOX class probable FMN-dependent enzyme